MLVRKEQAQRFQIPGGKEGTKGFLYPKSPRGDQSFAVIEMDGVYPEKGYSINDICTETIYMLEGSFEVEYQGEWHSLHVGDLIMLLPGNKYRTKGKGKAGVIISPSWDSKQNHIIEKE